MRGRVSNVSFAPVLEISGFEGSLAVQITLCLSLLDEVALSDAHVHFLTIA